MDVWEIGNEVNGNWLGSYADVSTKITDAYRQVEAAGKRSALTLYYDIGCGNGPSELDPLAFTKQYVPEGHAQRPGLRDPQLLRGPVQQHAPQRGDLDLLLPAAARALTRTPSSASARSASPTPRPPPPRRRPRPC
ncbi:hypothetical protein GCM10020229_47170 [Kitasatospora albolonga]